MRHFPFLSDAQLGTIFHTPPRPFGRDDDRTVLATALGATLYTPGTRPGFAKELATRRADGLTSTVICLEDAIGDADVALATDNVVEQLSTVAADLADDGVDLPLLFVRVRTPLMLRELGDRLGETAQVLTGVAMPKVTAANGEMYLEALADVRESTGARLFALPILESEALLYRERRQSELDQLGLLLAAHEPWVLNIRVGGTDMCGLLGLRRPPDLTIYAINAVRDVIADVVNTFGRGTCDHVISAPVWEYFSSDVRVFKPQLRESPFEELGQDGRQLRADLLEGHLDGLIREVLLDRANGLTGKTVIHPSHVRAVNALMVPSHEEYEDAVAVAGTDRGGAFASAYGNKMNEAGPHRLWAQRVLRRAHVFGVYAPGRSFIDVLEA